jgi:hypothetical protein
MNVYYASTTSGFYAGGNTAFYGVDSDLLNFNSDATTTLTATINNAGVLTGGTITITGDIGNGLETLLTGNLIPGVSGTAFGFADYSSDPSYLNGGDDYFQFLFRITGGDPAILENDFSGQIEGGVNLDAWFQSQENDTPFDGTWTSDFNNSANHEDGEGEAYVFLVPEPSPILLVLAGCVLYAAANRGRRKVARTRVV